MGLKKGEKGIRFHLTETEYKLICENASKVGLKPAHYSKMLVISACNKED